MRIGIVGAGRMGQTLARLAVRAGHHVQLANRTGGPALSAIVQAIGAGASGGTTEAVAHFGEMCIIAIRWEQLPAVASQCGDMEGRVVVDVTNNRFGPGPNDVYDLQGRSSSEIVAAMFPGAHLVKAFNNQSISALGTLLDPETPNAPALFLSGDDSRAKAVVSRFIREIGAHPLDAGSLARGGRLMATGTGALAGLSRLLSVDEATGLLQSASRTRGDEGRDTLEGAG